MQGVGQVASNDPGSPVVLDTPLAAAWDSIRTGLRRDCGARTFDGWLKPAELGAFDPDSGELELVMPSKFMADWVRSHFGERLTLAWRSALPLVREVRISACDAPRPSPLLILEEIPAPAASAVERDPNARQYANGMPGGPDNPLGARALYLYEGNQDTIYRIHGTPEPWSIGLNVSSGCIRMNNDDIIDLHSRIAVGAKVIVLMQGASLYKGV